MRYTIFSSPLGELLLAGDKIGLRRLCFVNEEKASVATDQWVRDDDDFEDARQQILAYLSGRRRSFSVDIATAGSEPQREIWAAVMRIPYGQTRTYGEFSRKLGHDKAATAISRASSANPLPILLTSPLVPNERVRLSAVS